jgi:UDPglucose 6-dehydrogenase/UDP-N-acetyl-D-galactosamine dehydrogenase
MEVIGYDMNGGRIRELDGSNRTNYFTPTNDSKQISKADFIIICVPTPVTKSKEPDLSYVISAAETVSQNMKKGSVVVLESTVYPGVTEEIVAPILERSGLKCGKDFKVAYSPERINPGDEQHGIDNTTKVVAGMDHDTTELIALLYGKITRSVFRTKNIKTAEAAKVIENTQRDLNIALVNELAMLFSKIGIDTKDVLDAAATKWNFNYYSPGLVGGHCIPVDPYYLVEKAKEVGFHTQVISAGRSTNDSMPRYVAEMTIQAIDDASKRVKGARVLVMGLTYKENVPDIRESPALGIIRELQKNQIEIYGYDPLIINTADRNGFSIEFIDSMDHPQGIKFDGIVITVAHEAFRKLELIDIARVQNENPVLIDVRGLFDGEEARQLGFIYRTL